MAWKGPSDCFNTFSGELGVFQGADKIFEANVRERGELNVSCALVPQCNLVCVIGSVPNVVALLNLEGFDVGRGDVGRGGVLGPACGGGGANILCGLHTHLGWGT